MARACYHWTGHAATVLLITDGLQALRTASLTTGLPMAVFLLVALVGLIRALRVDYAAAGIPKPQALTESPPDPGDASRHWDKG